MKNYQKHIIFWIAALLICLTVAGCTGGQQENPGQNPSDVIGQTEVTAANEQELRQYLAQDGELVIHVSNDMQIKEGFCVNGTKTLTGDAELKMKLGAELGYAILSVSENSALTLDGPVLDCNYNADGVFVETGAKLTCLSGTIKRPGAYGILTYGDVTVEDITIENSEFIAICAQTGSQVYVKGGSVKGSSSNDIYVVNGAYVNISGDTVMEGALEHAMINYGTLEINGGKFGNVNNYLCDNYGELTVAYKGEKADGAVEFYGARLSVFLIRKGSTASFSNVYIHDTERQGIASLGGDTVISDCQFVNTGSHSVDIQSGIATVERIVVTDSKGSGLEASNGAKVTVTDFTVNSCDRIGLASRGAEITATNVSISNTGRYGLTCGDTATGQGVLTVKDAVVTKTTMHGIYVYDSGSAEMENVSVFDGEARGIYVAATATCKIFGKSSFQNMAKGGVEVRGKLELNDVVICNNNTKNSGAGVYVANGGEVIMNGGAVYNNRSALRGGGICVSDATLTISGTNIYNNKAANHGGGIYVQNKSLVSLKSGKVTKNRSDANGDGIYILSADSQVKIAESFYLGGNDIKVDNVNAVVKFTGKSMKYHSASDPVLLTPNNSAPEGTAVAICNSESIADCVAVASGDGSYQIVQSGRKFVVSYAQADMDMTGADTVTVSNFKQLKAAVEGTTSKRNIIISGDIVFTERIRLPGGVTINIQDDGTKRTLTRAKGFTDSFFVTHYGTGLYLTGTAENMLVLDGTGAEGANKPLVRVAGSTEIRNVTLCNNGSLLQEHDVRGALVRQISGDIKIYDSVLSGGQAYAGGALMIDQGSAYVEGTTFDHNSSTIGGGAIRVASGCTAEFVSCNISENHAGSTGGGIVALGNAQVTVTNTKFENNTAASYGGAVSAQDPGTKIVLIGTDSQAVFKGNSSVTAGAVYAVKGVQLEISGYTFDGNAATNGGAGAVSVLDESTATITNTAFYNNTATASGGALSVNGSTAYLISCEFGKEGAGNTAGDKAGAILVTQGGIVEMTVADGVSGSVSYNTASGEYGGGAVYVDTNAVLKAEGYVFEGNQAVSGGAIYMAAGAEVNSKNNRFVKNATISKNGGAVYCAGTLTDTNSSYLENTAVRNGGAIIVMGGGVAELTATDAGMWANQAGTNNGGAIFVNSGSGDVPGGKLTLTGYTLDSNVTGGIQVQVGASAALKNLTFQGTGNTVSVNGSLAFNNLTDVKLIQANANATFTVNGSAGTNVEFKPKAYQAKAVLTKGEITEEAFQAACAGITVTPNGSDIWQIECVGNTGNLKQHIAIQAITGTESKTFNTLEEAVAYANGLDSAVQIRVYENISLGATVEIQKNITIVNISGKEITISRDGLKTDMFQVVAGGSLTLGTNDTEETGKLIIDGASTAAIAARTVTVDSGACFTLGKNATLQKAKASVAGGAIYTASVNTFVYGTIRDNVGKTGAGMHVAADANAAGDAMVQISGASFIGNRSSGTGGALQIDATAKVNCADTLFKGNKALTGSTYSNGGTVYVAGTFKDTNSTYTGNEGKNGGAVFLGASTAKVELTGTDATKALFTGNAAKTANGGAIFVNGGTLKVSGYTFEGNTSVTNADGAIHIANGSATVENAVFQGASAQKIYVNSNLTFQNLTDAQIVEMKAAATITLSGSAGTNVQLKPASYTEGTAVIAGESVDFTTITVIQKGDGSYCTIDAEGKLRFAAAALTTGGTTEYFNTLEAAVAKANTAAAATQIVLWKNASLSAPIEIQKDITIVNAAGKEITISRGSQEGDLFTVTDGGSLTLGINDTEETGKLIIDGASASAIAYRTVTVAANATFTLNKNATLQNANSTVVGAAIHTSSTNNFIYGTVQNNTTTVDCAGLYVNDNGGAVINGAVFRGNSTTATGAGAALLVRASAIVTCENAVYAENTVPAAKNGGAIYVAGTFTDTNSTYTENVAKNGGAIFLGAKTAEVTLTGTDAEKAVFQNNQAKGASTSKGGALYNNGGTLTVSGYTFTGNTSQQSITSPTDKKNAQIWSASGTTTLMNITMN